MKDRWLQDGTGLPAERFNELTRRSKDLPPEVRKIAHELLEAFSISMEELQVSAEELNQQNAELIASREELELQRSHYRELFDSVPDGYLITDPSGVIVEVNRAAVKLLGIPKEFLLQKPLVLYVNPEERDRFNLFMSHLAGRQKDDNKNEELEMRFQSRQGSAFPAALTVASIRDQQGKLTGLRWLLHDLTESKRAVRRELLLIKTREANRLLHTLIETMPVGAIIADSDGMITIINTAGRDILGSSVSGSVESPKQTFTTHHIDGTPLPPQNLPLPRAMREGKFIMDVEFAIRREDGEERIILSSASPIQNESGRIISGITIFQDITEQKRARTAMRQYTHRLQLLRSANDAILAANSIDELIETVLPYSFQLLPCQLAGLLVFDPTKDEAIVYGSYGSEQARVQKISRIPISEHWPLEELARGEIQIIDDFEKLLGGSAMMDALREQNVRSMVVTPMVYKSQLLGTFNLGFEKTASLSPDQLDIVLHIASKLAIGVLQIRQRDELQQYATHLEHKVSQRTSDLRNSEQLFRTIMEDSSFGIALLNTEGRIVTSNPAFRGMLSSNEEDPTGVDFGRFINLIDKRDLHEIYAEMLSGVSAKYQGESHTIRKNKEARWHQVTISPITQVMGSKPWLAVVTIEDITDKKKIQETLQRTERLTMAGRLGASLAHEINNPLQSVIGCLGLAEEMLEGNNNQVQLYIEIAMQELERTADIVSQLRDMSREPGRMIKKPTNLNALVEKTLLLTRKRCLNQSVEVKWNPDADLPEIPAAPDRIQQVLLNMVLNAVEAMDGGGHLEISTTRTSHPDGIRITLTDDGIGIEPNRLYTIFEPFNSNRTEGLGLGLFISRRIIEEEHGGHIDVKSQAGTGSTFTIHLPV